jgi:hypothetical protein
VVTSQRYRPEWWKLLFHLFVLEVDDGEASLSTLFMWSLPLPGKAHVLQVWISLDQDAVHKLMAICYDVHHLRARGDKQNHSLYAILATAILLIFATIM